MLILLNNFLIQPFLPPFLPPNDRLKQADYLNFPRACLLACMCENQIRANVVYGDIESRGDLMT